MLRNILPTSRLMSTLTTIDPKTVDHFGDLANIWWDTKSVVRILHSMNKFRVPWIQNNLKKIGTIVSTANQATPLENLAVLDVGCGGGILSEALSRLGAQVTGIDCCSEMINVAKAHAQNQNLEHLKYFCTTIEDHVVNNKQKYNVVVASETIEHVREQEIFVKYCVECLKPGGSIFFTTNSKTRLSKFLFITLLEDIVRIIPKGTHYYEMFIDIKDLEKLLTKENCMIASTNGLFYNPINNKWKEIKNKNVLHYVIHAVKM